MACEELSQHWHLHLLPLGAAWLHWDALTLAAMPLGLQYDALSAWSKAACWHIADCQALSGICTAAAVPCINRHAPQEHRPFSFSLNGQTIYVNGQTEAQLSP